MGQGPIFGQLVPVGGTANNPYILKALDPLFNLLYDGLSYDVAFTQKFARFYRYRDTCCEDQNGLEWDQMYNICT